MIIQGLLGHIVTIQRLILLGQSLGSDQFLIFPQFNQFDALGISTDQGNTVHGNPNQFAAAVLLDFF